MPTLLDRVRNYCRLCNRNNEVESREWPWCYKCAHTVRAYGIDNETRSSIRVWAKCHGNTDEKHLQKPREDVKNMPGNWLGNQLRMLVFFAG